MRGRASIQRLFSLIASKPVDMHKLVVGLWHLREKKGLYNG